MNCPVCNDKIDVHIRPTDFTRVESKPGDIMVCLTCTSVLQFLEDEKVIEVSQETIENNFSDEVKTYLRGIQQGIRGAHALRIQ